MYDVIILGQGIAALMTAALLKLYQIECIIIGPKMSYEEHNCFPLYHNDAEKGILGLLLKTLDLEIEKKPLKVIDRIYLPDYEIERPRALNDYRRVLENSFPDAIQGLRLYFQVIEGLGSEWLGLINGDLKFIPQDIPYCMKYSGLSYVKFVRNNFKKDPKLQSILLAALPRPDVALTVMAGYLHSQVFDSCAISGGMNNLRSKIMKFISEKNVDIIDSPRCIEVVKDEKNVSNVKVICNKTYLAKYIIDTVGNNVKSQKKGSSLSFYSIYLEFGENLANLPDTEIWYDYPDHNIVDLLIEERISDGYIDYPLIIWNPAARSLESEKKGTCLRIDIPICALGSAEKYKPIFDRALARAEARIPGLRNKISLIETLTPEEHGELSGFEQGVGTGWAFSVTEVMKNPMKMKKNDYLYDTSDWGFAWFSAASLVVKEIVKVMNNGE